MGVLFLSRFQLPQEISEKRWFLSPRTAGGTQPIPTPHAEKQRTTYIAHLPRQHKAVESGSREGMVTAHRRKTPNFTLNTRNKSIQKVPRKSSARRRTRAARVTVAAPLLARPPLLLSIQMRSNWLRPRRRELIPTCYPSVSCEASVSI
ncbi:hypothetical protein EVAR_98178_1 [Eumeta japonica]|uniref:Uncharacterized protein n=1 Tax=Eumeta variegata TaxID=151549 RepID=A0A4C1YEJ0_EUMVA|nr:hypothetical protein EVAR_98178_1 [Eumeta japonica]